MDPYAASAPMEVQGGLVMRLQEIFWLVIKKIKKKNSKNKTNIKFLFGQFKEESLYLEVSLSNKRYTKGMDTGQTTFPPRTSRLIDWISLRGWFSEIFPQFSVPTAFDKTLKIISRLFKRIYEGPLILIYL